MGQRALPAAPCWPLLSATIPIRQVCHFGTRLVGDPFASYLIGLAERAADQIGLSSIRPRSPAFAVSANFEFQLPTPRFLQIVF